MPRVKLDSAAFPRKVARPDRISHHLSCGAAYGDHPGASSPDRRPGSRDHVKQSISMPRQPGTMYNITFL